jgi:predicted glycoside hydrolase/deacetylase ChbG (UPF0249 family)
VRSPSAPILIVNADDLGAAVSATDAILTCHHERTITSATAMVYMEDSNRAAELAIGQHLPVGLHINLTSPYTERVVPQAVRERQARLIGAIGRSRAHKWVYDVRLRTEVDRCLRDQLDRFVELYGRQPTHFDSHHHIHVCPNVFLSGALRSGERIRNTLIWSARQSHLILEARRARQRLLEQRLRSPAAIVCLDVLLRQHGPLPDPVVESVLSALPAASAEVMAHPQDPAEFAFLMSEPWRRMLASRRPGSFTDLS